LSHIPTSQITLSKRCDNVTFSFLQRKNIIHLFPLHKGDMKICSPEKSNISRGQRPREIWLFWGWKNFHISIMQGKWMFYSTRPTFWWILNSFFHTSLLDLWFWYYIVKQLKITTFNNNNQNILTNEKMLFKKNVHELV